MLYQIPISKVGCVEQITYVEAVDALTAITHMETVYETMALQISGKDGTYINVLWTGYEFEARQVSVPKHSFCLPTAVSVPVAVGM
jgi:hypothetical protein